jgi:NAD(P)-dependent dehydrogenase (short-subunit alcohol dehydrogenase family)
MPDQTGRTVIITGANSGLGFETTLAFARKGARVVMACRSMSKAEPAHADILRQVPRAWVEVMPLDLASLASIHAFATAFQEKHDRLDLLINNAGMMAIPFGHTADGFETQFGVNHLGHFALTGLLLPMVMGSPAGRVVTVSSSVHMIGNIAFDNLDGAKRYNAWLAYGQSKIANLLFAYELQRSLTRIGSKVISASCHPGYAATGLQSGAARMTGSQRGVSMSNLGNSLFAQSAAMGALPTLYAATSPDVNGCDFIGPTAMFGMHGYPAKVRSNRRSYNELLARRLWEESERLTGVHYQSLEAVSA